MKSKQKSRRLICALLLLHNDGKQMTFSALENKKKYGSPFNSG